MTATVLGEIVGGGSKLAVMATGEVYDQALAAQMLGTLTPVFRKSDPPGALVTELAWPTVVQIANLYGDAWQPGPYLKAWIREHVIARTSPQPMAYAPPAGMTPYYWQAEGAALIATTGRALITDEPGCIYGDADMIVNRGGNARHYPLSELVRLFNGGGARTRSGSANGKGWDLSIPTMVQREVDGVVRLGRVVNAWASGVKTTYTVTTETGRTIRATDEHPFLTERGWLRLDELKVGDLVHVRGSQRARAERKPKPKYREVAGLRAHPHARGLGRRTSTHRVAYHRLVAEADINRMRVEDYVPMLRRGPLREGLSFLDPKVWAVHHKDHDHLNNSLSNLAVLTHAEHHRLHADEGKTNQVLYKIAYEAVASVEAYGKEETFDIEVEDDPHNFIADGFVVHNTGKSGTAVLGFAERWERLGYDGPAVIVCPASVVDSWLREWAMWAPHVKAVAWRDKPARKGDKSTSAERRARLIGTAEVYVASYDMVRIDNTAVHAQMGELISGIGATALVIDECHFLRNPTSARTRAVLRLAEQVHKAGGAIVGLSGTPITRDTGDLHPMLKALEPGSWPSKERFVDRYCRTMSSEDYGQTILGLEPLRKPEFDLCLLGQHRRVKKDDVLKDLPPKVYTTRTVDLPPRWRKVYDDFEQTMFAEMPTGEELSVMDAMSVYTHLSQLASAGGEVEVTYGPDVDEDTGEEKRHVHINLTGPSWKVDALMELLEERKGRQTIVCAPSRQLMELAGAEAAKQGYRVGYVVGGQTAAQRTAYVDAFQAGKLDLICVTTKAGGVGLTLTAADAVVFLQRPWELDESIQMEDRAHRIGAEHESLQIIDIIARGTIDSRRRDALRGKVRHLAEVVNDPRLIAELLGGKDVTERNTTTTPRELISA